MAMGTSGAQSRVANRSTTHRESAVRAAYTRTEHRHQLFYLSYARSVGTPNGDRVLDFELLGVAREDRLVSLVHLVYLVCLVFG